MSSASGKIFRLRNGWYDCFRGARRRCEDRKHRSFPRYGGRGIKFLLTVNEIIKLWNRDRGDFMLKPSLDRIDPDGDYCFENCRFMEFSVNVSRKTEDWDE